MITRISIENFKGIGDRIEVPIRPITLLFGPNSAGKSSIMHAIHYAREVLERHNVDADRTIAGGDNVNLGGFCEMVHRKKKDLQIKLRFDLDLSGVAWHEEFPVDEFLHQNRVGTATEDLSSLGLEVMSGWVELVVGFNDPEHAAQPVVLEYSVGLDDVHLATLTYVPHGRADDGIDRGAELADLNLYHPVIAWPEEDTESLGPIDFYFPHFRNFVETFHFGGDEVSEDELQGLAQGESYHDQRVSLLIPLDEFEPRTMRRAQGERDNLTLTIWTGRHRTTRRLELCAAAFTHIPELEGQEGEQMIPDIASWFGQQQPADSLVLGATDALPPLDRVLHLELEQFVLGDEEDESSETYSFSQPDPFDFLQQLLTRLIIGPGRYLRDCLAEFRYVGPIRQVPPPDHVPPRYPDSSRWASGLAAWDLLSDLENGRLVEITSEWLWKDDRLNTGHQLVAKRTREIERLLQDRMLEMEWERETPTQQMKEVLSELEKLPIRQRVYLRDVEKDVDLPPYGVGVGICQIVPVIVAIVADGGDVVQIEQPALHLHPTQQAAVGDLLVWGAMQSKRKTLLIETQSEHLILRILKRIRQTTKGTPFCGLELSVHDLGVLYVEPLDGQTNVFEIGVSDDGELLQPWPDKFFDQDYEERYG